MRHSEQIVDQFTRQAEQFAQSLPARGEEILQRIVGMAQPGPDDTALDVACGPGVLACALAAKVRYATGIDLTSAMLERARKTQQEQGRSNILWDQGDVTAMPYEDGAFEIVTCRFAFHHFQEPIVVLREMRRVCRSGGRIVVADSAPAAGNADAFNAMERMRDPSHTRALCPEELCRLFEEAGLRTPRIERMRLELELDACLARSYPHEGDEARIRALFEWALESDTLDIQPRRQQSRIRFSIPVAIIAGQVAHAS
jgi:ubiquinone/menaquinone biosynthesis C-methylase UbiE